MEWSWPTLVLALALLLIAYLLRQIAEALATLNRRIDQIYIDVNHALKPDDGGGYLARLTSQVEGLAYDVEGIRSYQEHGPIRSSDEPP